MAVRLVKTLCPAPLVMKEMRASHDKKSASPEAEYTVVGTGHAKNSGVRRALSQVRISRISPTGVVELCLKAAAQNLSISPTAPPYRDC